MKTAKTKILVIAQVLLLLMPNISFAFVKLNLEYPKIREFDLKVNQDLNQIIAWFYYFIVSIGGLAAFVMLIWAGFTWLISAGDPAKISEAKDQILSAFLGLLLILASYLILQLINPELLMLKLPKLH